MRKGLLSAALVGVLATSLAGKITTMSRVAAAPADISEAAVGLLRAHAMKVALPPPDIAPAWITGTRETCRIRIAEVPPEGWASSVVARETAGETLVFAVDGQFRTEMPVLRTRLENYRRRLLTYLGIAGGNAVMTAVAVSPGCPADILRPQDATALSR